MKNIRCPLSPVQRQHFNESNPILTYSRLGMGVNIGGGRRKMEKITGRNKTKEGKEWVDWNEKIFEDIREGMFEGMCLDEMIQWVEKKLRECQ
jgi:hypothetical protein